MLKGLTLYHLFFFLLLIASNILYVEPTAASVEPSTAESAVPQTVKAEVPQTESAPPSASKSSCSSPIGIQTGFLETRDIKTSTSQKGFTATDPWCATTQDDQQFMAVDLGEPFKINKVATLGKADDKNRFVSKYILEFSHDGAKWEQYQDPAGKRVRERFCGNSRLKDPCFLY